MLVLWVLQVCNLNSGLVQIEREGLLLTQINPSPQTAPAMSDLQLSWKRKGTTGQIGVEIFCLLAPKCSAPASMTFVRIKVQGYCCCYSVQRGPRLHGPPVSRARLQSPATGHRTGHSSCSSRGEGHQS